jgi:hypothetical protein
MAELRIQPKKKAPSPWLLVGIAVLLLAAIAYFYLRPDPTDEPAPTTAAAPVPAPVDSLAPGSSAAAARATPPAADDTVASPTLKLGTTGTTLLQLSPALSQLADRADLRDDAAIREQRDNFTSATARLEDGDAQASLRPGLVAAASLLLAVQQKAYPNLESEAKNLLSQANQLSGRDSTPAEQTQNREYLRHLSDLLNAMSSPAKDVL